MSTTTVLRVTQRYSHQRTGNHYRAWQHRADVRRNDDRQAVKPDEYLTPANNFDFFKGSTNSSLSRKITSIEALKIINSAVDRQETEVAETETRVESNDGLFEGVYTYEEPPTWGSLVEYLMGCLEDGKGTRSGSVPSADKQTIIMLTGALRLYRPKGISVSEWERYSDLCVRKWIFGGFNLTENTFNILSTNENTGWKALTSRIGDKINDLKKARLSKSLIFKIFHRYSFRYIESLYENYPPTIASVALTFPNPIQVAPKIHEAYQMALMLGQTDDSEEIRKVAQTIANSMVIRGLQDAEIAKKLFEYIKEDYLKVLPSTHEYASDVIRKIIPLVFAEFSARENLVEHLMSCLEDKNRIKGSRISTEDKQTIEMLTKALSPYKPEDISTPDWAQYCNLCAKKWLLENFKKEEDFQILAAKENIGWKILAARIADKIDDLTNAGLPKSLLPKILHRYSLSYIKALYDKYPRRIVYAALRCLNPIEATSIIHQSYQTVLSLGQTDNLKGIRRGAKTIAKDVVARRLRGESKVRKYFNDVKEAFQTVLVLAQIDRSAEIRDKAEKLASLVVCMGCRGEAAGEKLFNKIKASPEIYLRMRNPPFNFDTEDITFSPSDVDRLNLYYTDLLADLELWVGRFRRYQRRLGGEDMLRDALVEAFLPAAQARLTNPDVDVSKIIKGSIQQALRPGYKEISISPMEDSDRDWLDIVLGATNPWNYSEM